MRRVKACAVTLMAALAACGCIAASASGEESTKPFILPEPTEKSPLRFTWKAGKILIASELISIMCVTSSASGEFTSKRLGTISITLSKCAAGILTCTGEGSPTGVIEILNADLHLVGFTVAKSQVAGLAVKLAKSIKLSCGGFVLGGSAIALMDGLTSGKETKTFTALFHEAKSQQEFKECERDKEYCFSGEVHRKFSLNFEGAEVLPVGLELQGEVTLEKSAAFDF